MSIKRGVFIIFMGLRNTSAIQANLRNTLLGQTHHHRDLSTCAARMWSRGLSIALKTTGSKSETRLTFGENEIKGYKYEIT